MIDFLQQNITYVLAGIVMDIFMKRLQVILVIVPSTLQIAPKTLSNASLCSLVSDLAPFICCPLENTINTYPLQNQIIDKYTVSMDVFRNS